MKRLMSCDKKYKMLFVVSNHTHPPTEKSKNLSGARATVIEVLKYMSNKNTRANLDLPFSDRKPACKKEKEKEC
jgi:hypothetical protein